jgi:hypothetical protein
MKEVIADEGEAEIAEPNPATSGEPAATPES